MMNQSKKSVGYLIKLHISFEYHLQNIKLLHVKKALPACKTLKKAGLSQKASGWSENIPGSYHCHALGITLLYPRVSLLGSEPISV